MTPSSAAPIPIWMFRRGQCATTPAPTHAPTTDAAISQPIVSGSTCTSAMKKNACRIVGGVWPTFMVPGIRSSGTSRKMRNSAVVGANDPIPSVSKMLAARST
ncbi:MAG: hypothetical protein HC814_05780 [Rhodobacteraceae bacterium]|nr:hypothetical protein [Paracoccaceae bacterium]